MFFLVVCYSIFVMYKFIYIIVKFNDVNFGLFLQYRVEFFILVLDDMLVFDFYSEKFLNCFFCWLCEMIYIYKGEFIFV